jgi:hypothetical protein
MTAEEKLLTMRNLWEDMRQCFEKSSESAEICALVDRRVARIESGDSKLLNWDEVKGSIGRQ